MGYIIPVNLHWYQPKNIIFQLAGVNRYSPKKANINGYTANEKTKCNEILFFLKNIPTPNSKNDYCVFSPSIYSHNCPSYIVATITPQITYNNLSYCVFQLCTGIFPFTFLIVGGVHQFLSIVSRGLIVCAKLYSRSITSGQNISSSE